MTQIGHFTLTDHGYVGRLHFLTVDTQAVFVPTPANAADKAPDYRIHLDDAGGPEIGAGWKKRAEKAGDFVSVVIDDPTFPQPIRANLFLSNCDEGSWSLQWSRPSKLRDGGK
ncbi:MAG: DUF736 domain-containing protein [Rhodoblastus sp.]|nr:DUF736 domain-containing protein [Rhodoblastus sp.]MCC2112523.1 DUF736 domain-containing protein [Hyphomicrobiales bacterium]